MCVYLVCKSGCTITSKALINIFWNFFPITFLQALFRCPLSQLEKKYPKKCFDFQPLWQFPEIVLFCGFLPQIVLFCGFLEHCTQQQFFWRSDGCQIAKLAIFVPNQDPWSLSMPKPISGSSSWGIRNPEAGLTSPQHIIIMPATNTQAICNYNKYDN